MRFWCRYVVFDAVGSPLVCLFFLPPSSSVSPALSFSLSYSYKSSNYHPYPYVLFIIIIIHNNYKYTRVVRPSVICVRLFFDYAQARTHTTRVASASAGVCVWRSSSFKRQSRCGCARIAAQRQCRRAAGARHGGGPHSPCCPSAATGVCSRRSRPVVYAALLERRGCC